MSKASGVEGGGAGGESAPPKVLIWWKSWQNLLKSRQNLWKFGQNVCKPSQNRLMCFVFLKNSAQKGSANVFSGKLGEIWASLGEIWVNVVLDMLWFEKNAPKIKVQSFLCLETIFWSGFRASLGKFGQKPFAAPKICLLLHLCPRPCEKVLTVRN